MWLRGVGGAALAEEKGGDPVSNVETSGRLGKQRRDNVKGGRQHSHRVKVSPEEEGMLVARAAAAHVTVARLLVESALSDGRETPADRRNLAAELLAIRGLLRAVSNNVNQIARAANAGHGIDGELKHTLAAVDRICGSLDAYMNDSVVAR